MLKKKKSKADNWNNHIDAETTTERKENLRNLAHSGENR